MSKNTRPRPYTVEICAEWLGLLQVGFAKAAMRKYPPHIMRRIGRTIAARSAQSPGATFPGVGGWTFEIPQPPSKEPWRSDAKARSPYDFHVKVTEGGGAGADLVLGLNIRSDGREDLLRYIASTGNPYN